MDKDKSNIKVEWKACEYMMGPEQMLNMAEVRWTVT